MLNKRLVDIQNKSRIYTVYTESERLEPTSGIKLINLIIVDHVILPLGLAVRPVYYPYSLHILTTYLLLVQPDSHRTP